MRDRPPVSLAEAMRRSFEAAAEPFANWIASSGRVPSCAKGCAACCELLALITWPEAALLAEHLITRGLVAKHLPALQEQARRASFDGLDADSYWQARIPCAFLAPDRSCAVYDVRPGPCRWHLAYTAPAACEDRTPGTEIQGCDEGEPTRVVVLPLLAEMARQVGDVAYEAAPIPIMVLAALQDLGQDVGEITSPRAWLDRHGARVWAYHRRAWQRSPLPAQVHHG